MIITLQVIVDFSFEINKTLKQLLTIRSLHFTAFPHWFA